jgi:hypothetical protein
VIEARPVPLARWLISHGPLSPIDSLLHLRSVIGTLLSAQHEHVPYRNSKLTMLLKAALGGNSRTALVCCVSADEDKETRRTLEFGAHQR